MNADTWIYRVQVKRGADEAKQLIEMRLGVTVHLSPVPARYGGGHTLDFEGPRDLDLDFLRPKFLPPKDA